MKNEKEKPEMVFVPGEVPKIIKESLDRSKRENAEAQDKLIQQGIIEPGQELILPARLVLGLAERKNSTY